MLYFTYTNRFSRMLKKMGVYDPFIVTAEMKDTLNEYFQGYKRISDIDVVTIRSRLNSRNRV